MMAPGDIPCCSDRTGLRIMTDERSTVDDLSESACWALLRTTSVGRVAVWVGDHPDIFPINYAVDHGTVVFRSGAGTKVSAALSDSPVALETDGYDEETAEAWSVVVKEVPKRSAVARICSTPSTYHSRSEEHTSE